MMLNHILKNKKLPKQRAFSLQRLKSCLLTQISSTYSPTRAVCLCVCFPANWQQGRGRWQECVCPSVCYRGYRVEHRFNQCIQHMWLATDPSTWRWRMHQCVEPCIEPPCRTHTDGTHSHTRVHSHAPIHAFTFSSLHPERSLMTLSFSLLPYTLRITVCERVCE